MTALTPANQLTLLRMLLIPAFVILVLYGELGWALLVFVLVFRLSSPSRDLALVSLFFPAYYVAVSFWVHFRLPRVATA